MTSRIVLKLFLLTILLCTLILASIYIGQTVFFKDYYVNQKVKDIQTSLQSYKSQYESGEGDAMLAQSLAQDFYRDHGAWLAVLDHNGELIQTDAFDMELTGESLSGQTVTYKVPLYHLVSADEGEGFKGFLADQTPFWIYGIVKGSTLIPAAIRTENNGSGIKIETFENARLKRIMTDLVAEKLKNMDESLEEKLNHESDFNGSKAELYDPFTYMQGKVVKTRFQMLDDTNSLLYTNALFLDRINVFQTELLLKYAPGDAGPQTQDFEQSNAKYKLIIQPMRGSDGNTAYLYAMASLQPVDEAVQMVQSYYVYIIAFVSLLVLFASFYYSMTIARPLLRVNQMTKKLANLDFSAEIPIKSKDEIGDLSRNINSLSQTLHSYIKQLQDDIEKEKRLENTRKEFISGVSHELKTPLSVMKSCISILKDGVAAHKKDHYFAAMEKEVDKMDALIVGMLELAKYESGTYKLKMDEFDIDTVIEAVCEQFRVEMDEKMLRLHLQLSPVKVVASQLRIEQVMTNFITNAILYTPAGQAINVTAIEEADRVAVSVENMGARIPPEQLDKVWDRFYRGDTSRQRS
ncbi:HAMP domain-containing protein, partial [Paenibacillus sepulcri]|nr:HAMP domain-containing protein [Paenibacillus sepulcri]